MHKADLYYLSLQNDRNAVESTWPTPEIPYVISPELGKQPDSQSLAHVSTHSSLHFTVGSFAESRTDDILSAMAMVSKHTCVSFHKRTSETNYLLFVISKGYEKVLILHHESEADSGCLEAKCHNLNSTFNDAGGQLERSVNKSFRSHKDLVFVTF